jgi:PAS domain S-box-containing protein
MPNEERFRRVAGFVRLLRADTALGALSRRVLIGVVVIPATLSALLVLMLGWNEFNPSNSVALITIGYVLLGLVVIVFSAEAAVKLDESRAAAVEREIRLTAQLQQQAARLQQTVSERTCELHAAVEANARLASVAKHTTNAVIITDADGRVEWVNPAFEALSGYMLPEMLGQKPGPILQGPETDPAAAAELSRAIHHGAPVAVEILNYAKSGRPYWQLVSVEPVRDARGRTMNFISIQVDISAQRRSEERTRQLLQRLQLAAQSAALGIWEWDARTQLSAWDDGTLAIYGLTAADHHGTAAEWERCLHPEDRVRAIAARGAIAAGSDKSIASFRIVRPDGGIRHIESRSVAERDPQGRLIRVVGTERDVTPEREAADQMVNLYRRLDLALRASGFGVWELDPASPTFTWNDRMFEIYGRRREEFPATRAAWLECLHPDDRAAAAALVTRVLAGEIPAYDTEYRITWPDGTEHYIEAHGYLQRSALGAPLCLVGLSRDITVRQQLEQRLLRAEELSAQSSRLAQVGGWEIDLATSRVTWSGDTWRIHDTEENYQPTLATFLEFFPPEARLTVEAELQENARAEATMDLKVPLITAKGRRRWVRLIGRTDFTAGRPVRTHGAIQDVTAIHESDEAQRRLEVQLFQTQKIDTVGTLAGGIAHDFNNLLTGIIGYQELMAETLDENHPARDFLAEARNASLRARNLVEQILAFSRQSDASEHAPLDLHCVIEDAHRFLRATIPAQIVIKLELDDTCGPVRADATQIHQVLMNLGSNAAHAMLPDGGTIGLSLKAVHLQAGRDATLLGVPEGHYARISFSDTGHGMDAGTQQRIFDPFFTTKKTGSSTGLGLAVVHGIVRSHHGAISVESQPGAGTTFLIHLPICGAVDPQGTEDDGASAPRGAGESICVVDDETVVGRFTQLALENLGYRAVVFTSAHAALDALRGDSAGCALLLTDQTMPGMRGHELALAVRQFNPGLPIVIMSGYFSRLAPQMLAPIGRVELLGKPFTGHELAHAVHRALHRPAEAADAAAAPPPAPVPP